MSKIFPKFESIERNNRYKRNSLVYTKIKSDLDTPVSAYLKICKDKKNSFLLESVQDGSYRGRYSVIGMEPDIIWKCKKNKAYVKKDFSSKTGTFVYQEKPPLYSLAVLIKSSKIKFPKDLPPMSAGLIGYLSYETIEMYENIPQRKASQLELPDGFFIRPTIMAIFDNINNEVILATPIWYDKKNNIKLLYNKKSKELIQIKRNLHKHLLIPRERSEKKIVYKKPSSNISRKNFLEMVKKAKEFIFSGDIFQVVLSQRFKTNYELPAFELYRSLRSLNPSPFLFYLNLEDEKKSNFSLIGSSPEILVRLEKNKVSIRPIAGTRPRGKNARQDKILKNQLLSDPKELAEHLMLLDLGRNDVGKVSKIGSVQVTEKMKVEFYSHVMHIVSNVEGEAKNKNDLINILMSGFPAGTVSGAPKIRAMEIINKLEPESRGIYAGCVGYFSANGDMETCIVLRTAIVKDKKMYVQAGAGIVADSEPNKEYIETVNKAKALFKAAEYSYRIEK